MSDSLTIFSQSYSGVAGFKATDTNNNTLTYIRPQGTKSISANGTGIDVTEYAAVDVNVSGGGSSYTLLHSEEFTVSTTSTTATSVGTMSVSNSYLSTKIIYVRVRDKAGKRNGYFYGTDSFFLNYFAADGLTSELLNCGVITFSVASNGQYSSTAQKYGVYPYSITSDGKIKIYRRYNSSNTRTINGTYVVDVYSLDPPAGKVIFG